MLMIYEDSPLVLGTLSHFSFFLLVAGTAAGLETDVHTCSTVVAKAGRRRAARVLRSFPVRIVLTP